jgi:hypothetical protein
MATDPATQSLGIKGVYQLQGGIDKYFKEFPDGGYWKGKNYTFDKRNAHAPPALEAAQSSGNNDTQDQSQPAPQGAMGKCASCSKAWDEYRGKQRCPTCGVPSLICRDCWQADQDGKRKLERSVRCELCVEQDIRSKKDLRAKEQEQIAAYEARTEQQGLLKPSEGLPPPPNLDGFTRLYLKNMCRKSMSEEILLEHFPDITHVVWRNDRQSGKFLGQAWVEVATPEAAAIVVAQSGLQILGRPLYAVFDPPGGKDAWPPSGKGVAMGH